jgi:predicted nuclease of predicted toxin-antitoxin system
VRFFLDNDVDARCRRVLVDLGHDCWTTSDARRADADDDAQTAYAQDRKAVVVTHDHEYTQRRRLMPIGRHLRLDCEQPDATQLLRARLGDVLALLERHQDIVIELGVAHIYTWFGTEPLRRAD